MDSLQNQTSILIDEYNNVESQLAPLRNSENHMHNLDSQVTAERDEIGRQRSTLGKTQKDDTYLQKRIHRNKNPRFLHYFVFNREAKVERLEGEHQQLLANIEELSSKVSAASAQLSSLQQEQQQAHATVDTKHQLQARRNILFEQVVDLQPPSVALQQLRNALQQQSQLLASERQLQQHVSNSAQSVQQGLALFQKAEGLYRRADNVNERAKQVNREEAWEARRERRDEACGDEFGAENHERNKERLEAQERRLQSERDGLINEAHDVAVQAYHIISSAFSSFPLEARNRYPQLCASIGQVAFPRVEGANFTSALIADTFFGTMGAAVNDFTSGCKIQKNMRTVEQCASLTSQQLGLVHAMLTAVQANVQQLEASTSTLQQNISAERSNIFNAVRAALSAP